MESSLASPNETALHWKRAADQGDTEAQYRYGLCPWPVKDLVVLLILLRQHAISNWLRIRDTQRLNTDVAFVLVKDWVLMLILLRQHAMSNWLLIKG